MENNSLSISVLMTTYIRETPENLDASMASIYAQTLLPAQFVLVLDGPILPEQDKIVDKYLNNSSIKLDVIRLGANVGRGAAKNIGLAHCAMEFVAIMDSDDISENDRFERQVDVLKKDSEIGLVAGWQLEFDDKTKATTFLKKCPQFHDEIVKALKWRNVVPNPAIMVKREFANKVGGYGDFKMINEDYDFFIKLIRIGVRFYNIQSVLINVRTSSDQRKRRGGWNVISDDFKFRYSHYKDGFYSLGEFIIVSFVYLAFRLMPSFTKTTLYKINRSI